MEIPLGRTKWLIKWHVWTTYPEKVQNPEGFEVFKLSLYGAGYCKLLIQGPIRHMQLHELFDTVLCQTGIYETFSHIKLLKPYYHKGMLQMKLKIVASPSFNLLCGPCMRFCESIF
jgi:hypothetical protein